MMLTPELFRTDMPTARLYGFLMDQYRRDPSTLQRDLPHLPLDASDWAALSERVGWATWEDCRQAIVTRQGNDHPSTRDAQLAPDVFGQLEQFYADRRVFLLPRVSVWLRHKGTEQALDVVDVADLQAQLRSRRIRRVLLAHRNPLTDGITHPQADTAVDGLDTTHLDWIGGGDGRMLDCR